MRRVIINCFETLVGDKISPKVFSVYFSLILEVKYFNFMKRRASKKKQGVPVRDKITNATYCT